MKLEFMLQRHGVPAAGTLGPKGRRAGQGCAAIKNQTNMSQFTETREHLVCWRPHRTPDRLRVAAGPECVIQTSQVTEWINNGPLMTEGYYSDVEIFSMKLNE